MAALQRIGGRYTLRERIGAGGMGEVWLARDEGPEGFQKTVVVKRMLPEAAEYLDYFRAEARLVAQLPHQNITQVLNFFIDEDGQHNIVMEYVEGTDLEELIFTDRGRLSVEMAVYIACEVLRGLDFAHAARIDRAPAGLVHRDISPHNILVSYGAEVKVTDFGIAKAELEYRKKTEGAKFRGKLAYAAPEALDESDVDRRADIYATGVVLREMLIKDRAFQGTMWQLLIAVKEGRLTPLRELAPAVPQALADVVDKMMHIDRNARFATAGEARAALMRAVPEWALADGPLRDFVRLATRRRPRLTSPFIDGDGTGAPMGVREEGSPVAIPVIKAGPDETTRFADAVTAVGRREISTQVANKISDAATLPAGIHQAPTHMQGTTAIKDVLRSSEVATARPQRSSPGSWGAMLLGVGVAFCVSAGALALVKSRTRDRESALTRAATAAERESDARNTTAQPTQQRSAQVPVLTPPFVDPTPRTNPWLTSAPKPVPPAPMAAPDPVSPPKAPTRPKPRAVEDVGYIVVPANDNADVNIDGVYAGHSGPGVLRYTIAPGSHRVTMMNTNTFKRGSMQVTVARGKSSHVSLDDIP